MTAELRTVRPSVHVVAARARPSKPGSDRRSAQRPATGNAGLDEPRREADRTAQPQSDEPPTRSRAPLPPLPGSSALDRSRQARTQQPHNHAQPPDSTGCTDCLRPPAPLAAAGFVLVAWRSSATPRLLRPRRHPPVAPLGPHQLPKRDTSRPARRQRWGAAGPPGVPRASATRRRSGSRRRRGLPAVGDPAPTSSPLAGSASDGATAAIPNATDPSRLIATIHHSSDRRRQHHQRWQTSANASRLAIRNAADPNASGARTRLLT